MSPVTLWTGLQQVTKLLEIQCVKGFYFVCFGLSL